MTIQRTELHDDLRALIAAGRELSPEDDAVLADMFLDRLGGTVEKPRTRHSLSARNVRRCAGGVVLALALLTGGALVSVQGTSHQGQSSVVQPSKMNFSPDVKVVPVLPSGKQHFVRVVPVPKDVPLQPKG